MKVLIVGIGFVGLTTACVLASRDAEVFITDLSDDKLDLVMAGELPFFETGLKELLERGLSNGSIKRYTASVVPDLTIIAVGTPSRKDGSIDLSYVESAISSCNSLLAAGSLVAIKSTVVPGTTRGLQNSSKADRLELLMIPEFLREGTAVRDALQPDRNVIGARTKDVAIRAAEVLGVRIDSCIITSTDSAEMIKYLSNAFLATCISFTNEFFSCFNSDYDVDIKAVLKGWHLDRRFSVNGASGVGLTDYLIPGLGFGGSCFPKDVRALNHILKDSGTAESIINSVLKVNRTTLEQTASWVKSQIPSDEPFVILGMGFKENTDDIRESPSIALAEKLGEGLSNVYWHDFHIDQLPEFQNFTRASSEILRTCKFFILVHNNPDYRRLLEEICQDSQFPESLTVFAVRYQSPVEGYRWLLPRMESPN